MIRRRLHRRYYARGSEGDMLLRSMRALRDTWDSRYNDWHVARYGEQGRGPLWLRPFGRFVCWVGDWRTTLYLRKPISMAELRSLDPRAEHTP